MLPIKIVISTSEDLKNRKMSENMYSTPYLNTTLYLHSRGFTSINGEVLSKFTNTKCLHLQGNLISMLDNYIFRSYVII